MEDDKRAANTKKQLANIVTIMNEPSVFGIPSSSPVNLSKRSAADAQMSRVVEMLTTRAKAGERQ